MTVKFLYSPIQKSGSMATNSRHPPPSKHNILIMEDTVTLPQICERLLNDAEAYNAEPLSKYIRHLRKHQGNFLNKEILKDMGVLDGQEVETKDDDTLSTTAFQNGKTDRHLIYLDNLTPPEKPWILHHPIKKDATLLNAIGTESELGESMDTKYPSWKPRIAILSRDHAAYLSSFSRPTYIECTFLAKPRQRYLCVAAIIGSSSTGRVHSVFHGGLDAKPDSNLYSFQWGVRGERRFIECKLVTWEFPATIKEGGICVLLLDCPRVTSTMVLRQSWMKLTPKWTPRDMEHCLKAERDCVRVIHDAHKKHVLVIDKDETPH